MRFLPLLATCCVLASCQKVKDVVARAKDKLSDTKTAPAAAARTPDLAKPGGEVDKGLASLIDRNEEGVRLRKDLPFPSHLEIHQTEHRRFSEGRSVMKTALGTVRGVPTGTSTDCSRIWSVKGDSLTVTVEQAAGILPEPTPDAPLTQPRQGTPSPSPHPAGRGSGMGAHPMPQAAAQPAPLSVTPAPAPATDPSSSPVSEIRTATFHRVAKSWQPEKTGGDFARAVWISSMASDIELMALEAGAISRRQWFGSRLKEGASFTLAGKDLEILFPPGTTGKVTMGFEKMEPCGGHPCALFTLKGSISYRRSGDDERGSYDVTILDGKAWLSVIYPLVIRKDCDLAETFKGTIKGAPALSNRRVTYVSSLEWKQGA